MLKIFRKNKIREDKLAAVFVDYFLSTIDNGFPEVVSLINESPEFVKSPEIDSNDSDKFLLIALSANLMAVQRYFSSHIDMVLSEQIIRRVSELCNVDYSALSNSLTKNQSFISKVNHPSKNLIYGMSKALFYKYNLNQYQELYFRNVNSPNPIFLKRLDDAMSLFMWNWEEIAQ